MNDDVEATCKGYIITLEHKTTKERMVVSLSETSDKWIVKGDGYQGFFKDLDGAYNEACRHLRFKLGGGVKIKKEDE